MPSIYDSDRRVSVQQEVIESLKDIPNHAKYLKDEIDRFNVEQFAYFKQD